MESLLGPSLAHGYWFEQAVALAAPSSTFGVPTAKLPCLQRVSHLASEARAESHRRVVPAASTMAGSGDCIGEKDPKMEQVASVRVAWSPEEA